MKVIYVAGKYTSSSEWGLYQNIHHAREVAHRLWDEGWAVICPHSNTSFFGGEYANHHIDREIWIKGDLEILSRCDAIYMLNNWQKSRGAIDELKLAEELGLEVYYE
uniref:DUF4406 domain-containing protein n=1 Tax=viral metagenome TaxID=1070528 RepID=A0A6M3LAX0_9ZZZZ